MSFILVFACSGLAPGKCSDIVKCCCFCFCKQWLHISSKRSALLCRSPERCSTLNLYVPKTSSYLAICASGLWKFSSHRNVPCSVCV